MKLSRRARAIEAKEMVKWRRRRRCEYVKEFDELPQVSEREET
jgi:hypothetical protein